MDRNVPAVVATLFETGHYEAGVAALLNSLLQAGFRGRIWCGVRGVAPDWLAPAEVQRCVGSAFTVNLIQLETDYHLALYKPHFMMRVAQEEPAAPSLVYLDPDIVVKCKWDFVERWCGRGIAAIADAEMWFMPASSPGRRDWLEYRQQVDPAFDAASATTTMNVYCNSGFVGVSKRCEPFWELWRMLLDETVARGPAQAEALRGPRPGSWFADQELFNIALMDWASDACIMGPEAMDFAPGGDVFNHAIGTPKPWQRHFVRSALVGHWADATDWTHFRYREGPFLPIAPWRQRYRLATYRVARAIGGYRMARAIGRMTRRIATKLASD